MKHEFFGDIDWELLLQRKPTGNFTPDLPRYSIKDFVDEFKESTLTAEQQHELYYGKQEQSKLKDHLDKAWVPNWDYVRNPELLGNKN